MINKLANWVSFSEELKERISEAEAIVAGYDIMLNDAHLSENKGAACEYARQEINAYKRKWQ